MRRTTHVSFHSVNDGKETSEVQRFTQFGTNNNEHYTAQDIANTVKSLIEVMESNADLRIAINIEETFR